VPHGRLCCAALTAWPTQEITVFRDNGEPVV
jgi:hypothetical protein